MTLDYSKMALGIPQGFFSLLYNKVFELARPLICSKHMESFVKEIISMFYLYAHIFTIKVDVLES